MRSAGTGERSLEIVFTGDVSFTGSFAASGWTVSNVEPGVREFLQSADHVVMNLEGPLGDGPTAAGDAVSLQSPCRCVGSIRELNGTVLNLSNNHILDAGREGLARTLLEAGKAGIRTHGAGLRREDACRPIVVEGGGVRVALLAFSESGAGGARRGQAYTSSGVPRREMKTLIAQTRGMADFTVVQYHGGDEYCSLPSPRRVRLMRDFISWGASGVICHHAHVVQPWEVFGEGVIWYGLGNFIFDVPVLRSHEGTDRSLLVKLRFATGTMSYETLATGIEPEQGRVRVLSGGAPSQGLPSDELALRYCEEAIRARIGRRGASADGQRSTDDGRAPDPGGSWAKSLWRIPSLIRKLGRPGYRRHARLSAEVYLRRLFRRVRSLGQYGPT